MEMLNVRCCCTPTKIFGQYPWPTHRNTIKVVDVEGEVHILERRVIASRPGLPYTEYAIYSEDRPIEFWRMLPGFVEAKL